MFGGMVSKLAYDPTRWIWEDGRSLLNFSTTKGRKMLAQLSKNVVEGWPTVIPSSFEMKWADLWLEARVKRKHDSCG
jgi:hypothetical protein